MLIAAKNFSLHHTECSQNWFCFLAVYKKHYPPALHDEVWRLDRIAKDGALHKKLMKAAILTVEDFLRLLVRDPQKLRNVRLSF